MSKITPLSEEDHQRAAALLSRISEINNQIGDVLNGKVPATIIDEFCTYRGIDRAVTKIRSKLENELARRHPRTDSMKVYFG